MVGSFGFGRRDVADGLEETSVVEPVDPFQRGELDGFEGAPWSASMDDLGLVEAVDRLGQGVVIAVADAAVADAYGWGEDARIGSLTDTEILARLFQLNQQRR